MRRFKPIVLLVFICIAQMSNAQSLGTIRVNENYSATCEFEVAIKNIYISNNDLITTISTSQGSEQRSDRLYDYIIDGKTVIFSSYKELAPKSITIKLFDESTWYGIIEYDKQDKQIFYPFTDTKKKEKQVQVTLDSITKIKTRLANCLMGKSSFQPFGINKNRIFWEISNIMTDENFTYIKILVNNRSAHIYDINNGRALFEYIEGKSKNLKKKEASVKVDGLIVYQEAKENIHAYSTQVLGYVVKSYPLNRSGKLIVRFIESSGKRNYEIKIPFKYLEKVKVFND